MRLDQLLVTRNLVPSRTQSQVQIRAGRVMLAVAGRWQVVRKPAMQVAADCALKVLADTAARYVSRAGMKLAAALERVQADVADHTVLDVGQSTGGFTDCVLQAGAARVIGVDVGHQQLAPRLRDDPRVRCVEGRNARYLHPEDLAAHQTPPRFHWVVMDVSFISQTLILPRLAPLLADGGRLLSLVKPQFEVGPQGIGKGGLVKDPAWYPQVREKLFTAVGGLGLHCVDYFESAITGSDGNREFFIYVQK